MGKSSSSAAAAATEKVVEAGARSVAGKPLPPLPADLENGITQILFYQYVEPVWSARRQKQALAELNRLAQLNDVTGRGRIALEGLNCTLTGSAQGTRAFCEGMRAWDPNLFNETDFKLTDNIPAESKFKALTIKSTQELVAYGLGGERAPLLGKNTATHLEADEYHKMLSQPDTVVIDVRNYYETVIGRIEPPKGGAEFLDPMMRNSREFPKWLNAPETKEKLKGKKVMMYCTGGIRCERATALLSQMERAEDELETQGIFHVRGGIDRYLKTFPEGGYWKGRNYLFDLRGEQAPELKAEDDVNRETSSYCCVCKAHYSLYKGKHACSNKECKVPVIVCNGCKSRADSELKAELLCPLCESGHVLRDLPLPDLVGQKRKLALEGGYADDTSAGAGFAADAKAKRAALKGELEHARWLHVAHIPLTATADDVRSALAGIVPGGKGHKQGKGKDKRAEKKAKEAKKKTYFGAKAEKAEEAPTAAVTTTTDADTTVSAASGGGKVEWIPDRDTGFFYGSCYVEMPTLEDAEAAVARAVAVPTKFGGRFIRVNFAPARAKDAGRAGHSGERPPVPAAPGGEVMPVTRKSGGGEVLGVVPVVATLLRFDTSSNTFKA